MKKFKSAWDHYTRKNDYAVCKICNTCISYKASSTTGLIRHLVAIHDFIKEPQPQHPLVTKLHYPNMF